MATSGSTTVAIFSSWLHLKFSWWQNSQSVADNTTNIGWQMDLISGNGSLSKSNRTWTVTIDGKTYSGTVTVDISANSTQKLASGTAVISHNADGTKTFSYSFSQQFGLTLNNGSYMGTYSGSGSDTLPTIARASQPSLVTYPNTTQNVGNFGVTFSIHMNRQSSAFTHTVRYAYGNRTGTIATNVGTGTTWAVPLEFMNDIPNATSGKGTIYVDTYNGSTFVGTKWTGFTATVPASVKPSCTLQVLDGTDIQSKYGNLVKGLSKLYVKVTGSPSYNSPITAYAITANGRNYSAKEITTGFITQAGTTTITAKVTDKRGRVSDTKSASFPVIDYAKPSITELTVGRCDADGTANEDGNAIKVSFAAKVTPLNNKNSATYVLRYKKTTESQWEQTISFPDLNKVYSGSGETIFDADPDYSYNVQLEVSDDFPNNTAIRSTPVSTAFTLMDWHSSGSGIAFGKASEKESTMEVGLASEFIGDVSGRAMGLGSLPRIPDYSDFNRYTDIGCYGVVSDASAATMENCPVEMAGRLIVSACTGWETGSTWDFREQLYLPHDMFYGKPGFIRMVARRGSTEWDYGAWNSTALQSYPVGSIYIAYNHTSPAELFGGAWTRISNAFLWGCDASGTIGQTGGEKTHTLTNSEMPAHNHGLTVAHLDSGQYEAKNTTRYGSANTIYVGANYTQSTGGGAAHNNMPPYIQVSIWRRTA